MKAMDGKAQGGCPFPLGQRSVAIEEMPEER
jgi:hypothetical protein